MEEPPIKFIKANVKLKILLNQWARKECTLIAFKEELNLLLTDVNIDFSLKADTVLDEGQGNTALHYLLLSNVENCNYELIKDLLEKFPALVKTNTIRGLSPLQTVLNQFAKQECSFQDFRNNVQLLISTPGVELSVEETCANFTSKIAHGNTLLHQLLLTNYNNVNKSLIELVFNYCPQAHTIKNKFNLFPLQALMNQYSEINNLSDYKLSLQLLIEQKKIHKKNINFYVQETTKDNYSILQGNTILHHLVLSNLEGVNNKEISDLLAVAPDLLYMLDNFGRIPLQSLILQKNFSMSTFEELLKKDKNQLNTRDKMGNSLLHTACMAGNLKLAQYLISQGLSIEDTNLAGDTVWHCATYNENKAFWKWLSAFPISLNTQNLRGDTALHKAVQLNNYLLIKELIKKKADLSLRNTENNSPLKLAYKYDNPNVINPKDKQELCTLLNPDYEIIEGEQWVFNSEAEKNFFNNSDLIKDANEWRAKIIVMHFQQEQERQRQQNTLAPASRQQPASNIIVLLKEKSDLNSEKAQSQLIEKNKQKCDNSTNLQSRKPTNNYFLLNFITSLSLLTGGILLIVAFCMLPAAGILMTHLCLSGAAVYGITAGLASAGSVLTLTGATTNFLKQSGFFASSLKSDLEEDSLENNHSNDLSLI